MTPQSWRGRQGQDDPMLFHHTAAILLAMAMLLAVGAVAIGVLAYLVLR